MGPVTQDQPPVGAPPTREPTRRGSHPVRVAAADDARVRGHDASGVRDMRRVCRASTTANGLLTVRVIRVVVRFHEAVGTCRTVPPPKRPVRGSGTPRNSTHLPTAARTPASAREAGRSAGSNPPGVDRRGRPFQSDRGAACRWTRPFAEPNEGPPHSALPRQPSARGPGPQNPSSRRRTRRRCLVSFFRFFHFYQFAL